MMRILLTSVTALALSGCAWLDGQHSHYYDYGPQAGYGRYTAQAPDCCGGEILSRWNAEAAIGKEYFRGDDIITGASAAKSAVLGSRDISFKEAYDAGTRLEFGGSYALSPNRKLTLMAHKATAEGQRVTLAEDPLTGDTVAADVGDYKRTGIELGLRQYGQVRPAPVFGAVRPYAEGKLGLSRVDDIRLENVTANIVGTGTVALTDATLYNDGWIPTASGMVGVEAPVFDRATLALETGLRYSGSLDTSNDLATAYSGYFEGANEGGSNWSVPVMLRGRYRF